VLTLEVVVFIDGLAEPSNPGTGTYGYVIYCGSKKLAEDGGLAGRGVTNNFAEYSALVMALKKLKSLGITEDVTIRSDSKLLVGQMGQGWKVKKGGYVEKFNEAKELLKEFGPAKFEWVPREDNREADLLSRIAYNKYS